jgi:Flp pilus assembly protein TadD
MMRFLAAVLLVTTGCATDAHIRKTDEEGEMMRFQLAETYVHKGAYAAAIPLLRREVTARPRSAAVHGLYGVVLREQGLYPQAERELRSALALEPANARAHDALGILYDLMHRPVEAESAHRAALAIAPGEATFWNNLGFSLYVARKDAAAVAALEKALAIDPSLAVAYNNLGFAYGRHGDDAGAERCFRTSGGDVGAQLNMAIVYEQRGETERASKLRADAGRRDGKLEMEAR